ncbi:DUF2382 domain-containing protein [Conexibacter arvalis]|uniref:Uncharacterized protein (TIGR02271 family) n=1 Tax=Conexibacter arvalis TaxID=912552 RepID=A0A840IJW4_9ACTN|nr:PRC and DUF2382 domain-containing protein [Conexibacter arvalis]MBB4664531.1 uncharacterized protein (TIGR02271 family) [Conexibacter arvalis]
MTEPTHAYGFENRTLIDRDGEKIGKVEALYRDLSSGRPEWALVHSGLFGLKRTFVPLHGAQPAGEDLRLPIEKAKLKDAPHIDPDTELTEAEEQRLFTHYEIPYTTAGTTTAVGGEPAPERPAGAVGHDVSGPTTDDAMTRSEEELRVGTRPVERGRVRLRKVVVTEHVQTTVPVRHEEVRIEREPITEENVDRAMAGPEISEEEHEVVLHAEEPVVEKRAVPKERVRLQTESVTEEREISEEVRKERIETDERTP